MPKPLRCLHMGSSPRRALQWGSGSPLLGHHHWQQKLPSYPPLSNLGEALGQGSCGLRKGGLAQLPLSATSTGDRAWRKLETPGLANRNMQCLLPDYFVSWTSVPPRMPDAEHYDLLTSASHALMYTHVTWGARANAGSDSAHSGRGLRSCISDQTGDSTAAGLGRHSE